MTLEEALEGRARARVVIDGTRDILIEYNGQAHRGYFYRFPDYSSRTSGGPRNLWRLAIWHPATKNSPHPERAKGAGDWEYWAGKRDFDELEVRLLLAGCTPYPQE